MAEGCSVQCAISRLANRSCIEFRGPPQKCQQSKSHRPLTALAAAPAPAQGPLSPSAKFQREAGFGRGWAR